MNRGNKAKNELIQARNWIIRRSKKSEKKERAWLGGDGSIKNDISTLQEIQFLLPGTILDSRDTRWKEIFLSSGALNN